MDIGDRFTIPEGEYWKVWEVIEENDETIKYKCVDSVFPENIGEKREADIDWLMKMIELEK